MKQTKRLSISVFFPCYNDSKSIGKLIEDASAVLESLKADHEIIVIDDGSKDNSRTLLKRLAKKYPNLKLIFHEKNMGYGGVLKTGFKNCTKELIFYTDGDGQYDVKELPILLHLMTGDVNFINGIKMTRQDYTYRVIIGNLYSFVIRWLFLLPTHDVDCDFRLIRSDLVKKLNLKNNSGSICVELVKKSQRKGAKFRQVSIHHYERKYGQSQFFIPRHLITTFGEICFLWFNLMIVDVFKKN